jgi:tRNA (adenine37-N6)-methyltransferase
MFYKLKHIGFVQNEIVEPHRICAENVISRVVILPKYSRALDGIESFSHIVVIFWLHLIRIKERSVLKVHPRNDVSNPLTGVFATHSPVRPNPIGVTTVELVERVSNELIVKGLDAINGTPVIDIKPFINEYPNIGSIRTPEWSDNR